MHCQRVAYSHRYEFTTWMFMWGVRHCVVCVTVIWTLDGKSNELKWHNFLLIASRCITKIGHTPSFNHYVPFLEQNKIVFLFGMGTMFFSKWLAKFLFLYHVAPRTYLLRASLSAKAIAHNDTKVSEKAQISRHHWWDISFTFLLKIVCSPKSLNPYPRLSYWWPGEWLVTRFGIEKATRI